MRRREVASPGVTGGTSADAEAQAAIALPSISSTVTATDTRAALFARERGHEVVLYEKTGYLGGQLIHAEYASFKWPLKRFRDWLVYQLDKQGVTVRLNTEPTREELRAEGFDAVIAATGAGVSAVVIVLAGLLIAGATRELRALNQNRPQN